MANTVAGIHLGQDTHANRPAATAVTAGTLYSCSDHNLVYYSDGSSWSTWAALSGGAGAGANSGARISDPSGTDQAITAVTEAAITFDTEDFDTDNYADLGTNNTRLTVSNAGLYIIGGQIGYNSSTGNYYTASIRLNGTTGLAYQYAEISATVEQLITVHTIYQASASDYFELIAFNEGGSDVFHKAYSPFFWIARL